MPQDWVFAKLVLPTGNLKLQTLTAYRFFECEKQFAFAKKKLARGTRHITDNDAYGCKKRVAAKNTYEL